MGIFYGYVSLPGGNGSLDPGTHSDHSLTWSLLFLSDPLEVVKNLVVNHVTWWSVTKDVDFNTPWKTTHDIGKSHHVQ